MRCFAVLLLLSIGTSFSSLAESIDPELAPVVVSARSAFTTTTATMNATPIVELPFSVTTISIQDLPDRQAQSIADLADYSAGVSRRANYWGVDTPTFQLRGFNAGDSSSYYKDGFRYQGRAPLSMANVAGIEILRGPQSALYGWSEPGGIVQVLTRQPTAQTVRNVSVQADSWGKTQTTLDLGGALSEESRFRWVTAYEQWGRFRDRAQGEQLFLAPSLALDFSEGRQLQLALEWLDDQRHTDYGIPAMNGQPANVPVARSYGEDWGRQHSQSLRFSGRWKQSAWGGELQLAYSYYQLKYLEYRDVEPYAVSGSTLKRWYESYPEQYRWMTTYADWSRAFALGEQVHRISSHLELAHESRSLYGGVWDEYTSIDILQPTSGLLWSPSAEYSVYDQAWRNRNVGLVLQDEIAISNWTWLLGIRFGYVRQMFDYADHLPVAGEIHQAQSDWSITPRIGGTWKLSPGLAIYGNYSTGAVPALPQSRSFSGETFSPVNSRQLETGIKMQPEGGDWLTTLAVFDIRRNNVLTLDLDHPNYSVQTGSQQSKGVEWQWQGKLAPLWQMTSQATWLMASITEDNRYREGNRLPYAPHFGASAWLTRNFLSDGLRHWRASGGFVHQGRRYADFANSVEIPAYTRFDIGVTCQENGWVGSLMLENVTDRRYYASGVENRPAVIYPGAPRTLMLRLSYDFQ